MTKLSHGGVWVARGRYHAAMERTEAERAAAVESMYRIRAVESPPDAAGRRTIWHRGAKGAELVSEVDGEGRVMRHELTLFDEQLTWEREKGFRFHGVTKEGGSAARPPSALLEDPDEREDRALDRAAHALEPYRGDDRIISHLRELVLMAAKGRDMFSDLGEVTRRASELRGRPRPPPVPAPRARWPLVLVALGVVLVLAALALLAAR